VPRGQKESRRPPRSKPTLVGVICPLWGRFRANSNTRETIMQKGPKPSQTVMSCNVGHDGSALVTICLAARLTLNSGLAEPMHSGATRSRPASHLQASQSRIREAAIAAEDTEARAGDRPRLSSASRTC